MEGKYSCDTSNIFYKSIKGIKKYGIASLMTGALAIGPSNPMVNDSLDGQQAGVTAQDIEALANHSGWKPSPNKSLIEDALFRIYETDRESGAMTMPTADNLKIESHPNDMNLRLDKYFDTIEEYERFREADINSDNTITLPELVTFVSNRTPKEEDLKIAVLADKMANSPTSKDAIEPARELLRMETSDAMLAFLYAYRPVIFVHGGKDRYICSVPVRNWVRDRQEFFPEKFNAAIMDLWTDANLKLLLENMGAIDPEMETSECIYNLAMELKDKMLPHIIADLQDPQSKMHKYSFTLAGRIGDPSLIPHITPFLNPQNRERRLAITTLGAFKGDEPAKILLNEAAKGERHMGEFASVLEGTGSKLAIPYLLDSAEKYYNDRRWDALATDLRYIENFGDMRSVPLLLKVLRNPNMIHEASGALRMTGFIPKDIRGVDNILHHASLSDDLQIKGAAEDSRNYIKENREKYSNMKITLEPRVDCALRPLNDPYIDDALRCGIKGSITGLPEKDDLELRLYVHTDKIYRQRSSMIANNSTFSVGGIFAADGVAILKLRNKDDISVYEFSRQYYTDYEKNQIYFDGDILEYHFGGDRKPPLIPDRNVPFIDINFDD